MQFALQRNDIWSDSSALLSRGRGGDGSVGTKLDILPASLPGALSRSLHNTADGGALQGFCIQRGANCLKRKIMYGGGDLCRGPLREVGKGEFARDFAAQHVGSHIAGFERPAAPADNRR